MNDDTREGVRKLPLSLYINQPAFSHRYRELGWGWNGEACTTARV